MLKLLAIDVREGWAFVEDASGLVLVRPPYQHQDKRSATAAVLARAVQDGDFDPKEMEFDDWSSLIRFIRLQVVDYAKRAGRDLDAEVGDELIAVAPPLLIEELLDQVETELFPAKEWAVAQAVLESVLLHSRLMKTNSDLHDRVRRLLKAVKENQNAFKKRREARLQDDNSGYKHLKRSGELPSMRNHARAIRNQGTLL